MPSLQRCSCGAVLAVGVVALIIGIILTVGGALMPGTIMDTVEEDQFPVLTHTGNAQVTMAMNNIIDTHSEVTDSADAIKEARWEASENNPMINAHTLDISGQTTVNVVNQGYEFPVSEINLMLGEVVFNMADMGIQIARIILFVGIGLLVMGLGLIVSAIMLNKTHSALTC